MHHVVFRPDQLLSAYRVSPSLQTTSLRSQPSLSKSPLHHLPSPSPFQPSGLLPNNQVSRAPLTPFPNKPVIQLTLCSLRSPHTLISPHLPDPFRYRLPHSSLSLIYSHWGAELPNFDDVITTLDLAEASLESEIKGSAGDEPLVVKREWKFGTAKLMVFNAAARDGLTHREALKFLWGMRVAGMVYGFWDCRIVFSDESLTRSERGRAGLYLVR